jgi:flagellar protein FlbT
LNVSSSAKPSSSILALPGSREQIDVANAHIASGALYKALKEIWKLMKREEEQVAA